MRALALLLLLVAPWAWSQSQEKPAEAKAPEAQPQQQAAPPRPLILRIDQLPPSERAGLSVTEEDRKPSDGLPELGGKPTSAYDTAVTRGTGTSAPGSPYPKDTQTGR